MIKILRPSSLALAASSLILSAHALAEPGDYGFWTTLGNLFNPPKANAPVTPEQAQGMYPLSLHDPDFDDGFDPGDYDNWQKVDVPISTGAMCGNGSPYKFFVYRVPDTSNTIFYFEGGGACWVYESCSGQAGIRGARNPNGIPDNYVQNINLLDFQNTANLATAAVSPLIYTHHPYNQFKTGEWNLVYVPYCTGDIYVGDKTEIYQDPTGQNPDLIWHHNGLRNVQAVVSWVKNNLQKPEQVLAAGCSAGSIGALLNYSKLRADMDATYGYLIDDSGPLFHAPLNSDDIASYPSVPLHKEVLRSWTTYTAGGDPRETNPINFLSSITPGFNSNELASLYKALSDKFPEDRLGITHFLADGNFSSYSYERFHEDIYSDPNGESRLNKLREKWQWDTHNNLIPLLDQTSNWGYYFPMFRDFNESHCTTILDLEYGEIAEHGLVLRDFLNNIVNYQGGAMIRAYETDKVSDFENNHSWFYDLVDGLL
ncbi:pectin acetylesterase-family hydrolase [Microbulbifer thermotolerans]|uniref:pectin acetylesterase-family hydrolase n=1 Tax=Microbulbifer thermotolerans TaxID=252514 RepID=UPI0026732E48|nr:pectin acetylesterase-family hydrolase [Microbulbifer thermotolerans]WKT61103.1 pectin acetylesterase-family hydrolase [Microbulbifer thermotolerans]